MGRADFGASRSGFKSSSALTIWFISGKFLFLSEFTSIKGGVYPTSVLGPEEAFSKH